MKNIGPSDYDHAYKVTSTFGVNIYEKVAGIMPSPYDFTVVAANIPAYNNESQGFNVARIHFLLETKAGRRLATVASPILNPIPLNSHTRVIHSFTWEDAALSPGEEAPDLQYFKKYKNSLKDSMVGCVDFLVKQAQQGIFVWYQAFTVAPEFEWVHHKAEVYNFPRINKPFQTKEEFAQMADYEKGLQISPRDLSYVKEPA